MPAGEACRVMHIFRGRADLGPVMTMGHITGRLAGLISCLIPAMLAGG